MELALLCDVHVLLVIQDEKTHKSLFYSSAQDYDLLLRKVKQDERAKVYTNTDVT